MSGVGESMDGEAKDFVIDDDGELVPVYEEVHETVVVTHVQAFAVITQMLSGELVVQVFGMPDQMLMKKLLVVMGSGVMMKQH